MIKRIKIKDAVEEWLDYKSNFVKESTCMSYAVVAYNYFLPYISKKYVHEITEEIIQKIVFDWMKNDNEKGVVLCETTAKNNMAIIKDFIKYAIKKKYIQHLELSIQIPKKITQEKIQVLSKQDYKQVIKATSNSTQLKDIGILITLYTGLRIGEICALKWEDIDVERKILSVSKTMQRIFVREGSQTYTKIVITVPKTKYSIREIPLTDKMIKTLKKVMPKNLQTYILTGNEHFIEPRTYRNYFNKFLDKYNIEHIKFHGLRHTFATKCIELGADYKTVSELLGHANVNITLNLYVHPQIEQKRKCIEILENAYIS